MARGRPDNRKEQLSIPVLLPLRRESLEEISRQFSVGSEWFSLGLAPSHADLRTLFFPVDSPDSRSRSSRALVRSKTHFLILKVNSSADALHPRESTDLTE